MGTAESGLLGPFLKPGGATHWARGSSRPIICRWKRPHGYEMFRDKADGCIKVVLQP